MFQNNMPKSIVRITKLNLNIAYNFTTMSEVHVISVNPGKSSMGELNPEATARAIRNRLMRSETSPAVSLKHRLNAIFAVGGINGMSRPVTLLFVRMLAGALLLVSGMMMGFGGQLPAEAGMPFEMSASSLILIVAGAILCLGMLTRPGMACMALYFMVVCGIGISRGSFLSADAMYAMTGIVFAVAGAGRHSVDDIMAGNIFRLYRRKRRRIAERRLSYEAFRYQ